MLSKAITWLKDWFGSFRSAKYPPSPLLSSVVGRRTYFGTPTMQKALSDHQNDILALSKSYKLSAIARKRTRLKEQLEQAKRQKKARKHLLAALEALTREELRIEAGK